MTRVDPRTLSPEEPSTRLPEYHDTFSLAPSGDEVAFGVSTISQTGAGRVGIRVLSAADLSVAADVSTGVYADYLAWLRQDRIVALLGECSSSIPAPPCVGFDEKARHTTVVAVDPQTQQIIESTRVPEHCDAAEVRGRALLSLAERRLAIIDPDGAVESVRLPREVGSCGELALSPDATRAYVVSGGGRTVAEVVLGTSRLSVHRFREGLGGETEALGLGNDRIVLAHHGQGGQPQGVEILDIGRESRTLIDRRAGAARVSHGRVLTYDGASSPGFGIGVRGYTPSGVKRFQLILGAEFRSLELAGDVAYAITDGYVAAIEIPEGNVLKRSFGDFHGYLLTEQQSRSSLPHIG